MNIYKYDIVFQEVPDHVSLAFYVCGCPLKCPGCHSPELWTEKNGTPLTTELLQQLITRYRGRITCVLFLGGEWHEAELCQFLEICHHNHLRTALYTGLNEVSARLLENLDYLKTGPWVRALGGLDSPATNQVFRDLRTGKILNHLFQHNTKEPSL
ncbi:anaerobic ribonucleoside-triphosphate reductase activating protein [Bdellovibrio bacteriovorus]|uniref:anaerobic ribonucleoside-triphosphate reductase activating protein n=1 Tax=Bdellovibrio bacteriovorus TaxID=959 RepID=UPI003A81245A